MNWRRKIMHSECIYRKLAYDKQILVSESSSNNLSTFPIPDLGISIAMTVNCFYYLIKKNTHTHKNHMTFNNVKSQNRIVIIEKQRNTTWMRQRKNGYAKLTFLQCSSKSILSRRHVVPGVLIFKSVVHRPSSDKCWGWYCWPASHNTAICGSQRGEVPCCARNVQQ